MTQPTTTTDDTQTDAQQFVTVYAHEEAPDSYTASIFLAGPTPRSGDVRGWRADALDELRLAGFSGVVFVPEDRSGIYRGDYQGQVQWEERNLERADCILFWVPRELETMPGFTTNVEWGRWEGSGKAVYGAPVEAPKNQYLKHYADQQVIPSADTLRGLVAHALEMVGEGALRSGGERDVPLLVWRTPTFQTWYANQLAAGNRLDAAKLVWAFRVGRDKTRVFCFALHANVWVEREQRNKSNEILLARTDISTLLIYERGATLGETRIVLVREFRAPVNNDAGFVYELPGGSTWAGGCTPHEVAIEEGGEEVGVVFDADRVRPHGVRQLMATFSVHRAHLFTCEATREEMDAFDADDAVHGNHITDSEMTYIEVRTIDEIRREGLVDWSTLGMVLDALS